MLYAETSLTRVKACGRVSVLPTGQVGVRAAANGSAAGFSGLSTCGSVWACPVCAPKIAVKRAEEVAEVIRWNRKRGGSAALLTLTMQHHAGMTLEQCWAGLNKAWSAVTSGRQWLRDKATLGIDGFLRVVEVTLGEANGWHVHVHALVLFDRPISETIMESFGASCWGRWNRALQRVNLFSLQEHGVDVRPVRTADGGKLGRYFAKIALEVTGGVFKKGGRGGRTPFELLTYAFDTGDAWALMKWREWEQASHGKKQLTWSNGLRSRVGLDAEQSDEDIATEQLGDDDLVLLPAATWRAVRDWAWVLLDFVEDYGVAGLCRFLDREGLEYHKPVKVRRDGKWLMSVRKAA